MAKKINITWTQPSVGQPIDDYVVEYGVSGQAVSQVNTGSSSPSYELVDLTDNEIYQLRIAGVNTSGQGAFTPIIYHYASQYPSAPLALGSGTPVDSGDIRLSWSAPEFSETPINDYTISYTPDGGSTTNINTNFTSYNLTNLDCSKNHNVVIKANNTSGAGLEASEDFTPYCGVPIDNTPAVADFDGSADYLTIPPTNGLRLTGNFTVEAWVEFDGSTQGRVIVAKSQLNQNRDWELRTVNSNGIPRFRARRGGINLTSSTSPVAGQWYHVASTYDGTTFRLFINGKQEASSTNTTNQNGQVSVVSVGAAYNANNEIWQSSLNGRIDKLRLTSMARYTSDFAVPFFDADYEPANDPNFADVELLLMMNGAEGGQVFPDSSNNNHPVSVVGDVYTIQTNPVSTTTTTTTLPPTTPPPSSATPAAVNFIGDIGGLQVASTPAIQLNGSMTLEGWIYVSPANPSAYNGYLFTKYDSSSTRSGYRMSYYYNPNDSTINMRLYTGTGFNSNAFNQTPFADRPLSNTWNHYASVIDTVANETRLYVNGVLVSTAPLTGGVDNNTLPLFIGSQIAAGTSNIQRQAFIRITKAVRYSANFTPSLTIDDYLSQNDPFFNDVSLLILGSNKTTGDTVIVDESSSPLTIINDGTGSYDSEYVPPNIPPAPFSITLEDDGTNKFDFQADISMDDIPSGATGHLLSFDGDMDGTPITGVKLYIQNPAVGPIYATNDGAPSTNNGAPDNFKAFWRSGSTPPTSGYGRDTYFISTVNGFGFTGTLTIQPIDASNNPVGPVSNTLNIVIDEDG